MDAVKRFPSDELDKILLRVPNGLRDRLRVIASHNHRSMNSEIVMMLEKQIQDVLETKEADASA
ncbi:Arc family DNA-binding protein [Rhizobium rhizogenes]|uniref:Arc family DNA-binding protein n=1 Tax=Rhizobium rhizogenes TaxID=359 RepID=UPI0015746D38|nr:Arc family DNA-binding protein [Rhizobium rhizogenes]NTG06893.1 Arc family DNA-binding protein [Rhizobium rhizogenes]